MQFVFLMQIFESFYGAGVYIWDSCSNASVSRCTKEVLFTGMTLMKQQSQYLIFVVLDGTIPLFPSFLSSSFDAMSSYISTYIPSNYELVCSEDSQQDLSI